MLYPASAVQRSAAPVGRRSRRVRRRAAERGFSLIELIVVVIIISLLAALAIPSITRRMQDRRTQQAAHEVMNLYRSARMRAMGRGSAVLVRFDTTVNPEGAFEVREAVRGTSADPNCNQLPVSSCTLTSWQNGQTDSEVIGSFNPAIRNEYADVWVRVEGPPPVDNNTKGQMDVCFTPMGRAFVRYDQTSPFQPLAGVPTADVWRMGTDSQPIGLTRQVMVLPNGHARMGTSRVTP